MKASIIMPFYNKWELTHARLMELYKYVPKETEIVLVNDASTDDECDGGVGWWKDKVNKHNIIYLKHKKNKGFGQSMNTGAKNASGDIFIFLSNDVVVSGDFVTEIIGKIKRNPDSLYGGEVISWGGGWNEFEVGGHNMIIPYANGWILACKKWLWEELGGFDSIYGKFDYEDIDLSTTAFFLGYNVRGLNSPNLRHLGGKTVYSLGIDRMKHTKNNRKIFEKKWITKFPVILRRLENAK